MTHCRCCGKALGLLEQDGAPIHTRCIPKHWGKHSHGVNASRCREFSTKPRLHLDPDTGATVYGPCPVKSE